MIEIAGKKVLIFGGTGGIGSGAKQAFEGEGAEIICAGSQRLNFQHTSAMEIWQYIGQTDPDIIVHSAGIMFSNSQNSYYDVFDVNFGSVWRLLNYYVDGKHAKKTSIVVVGSSSHSHPCPGYPLYAASKAALVSLVSSMAPKFSGTNVTLSMVNPGKTNTAMRKNAVGNENTASLLTPYEVGREIVRLVKVDQNGTITRLDKNG